MTTAKITSAPLSDDAMPDDTFPRATEEQWRGLVDAVLKGQPFDRLVAKTYDGIAIQPLYAGRRDGAPLSLGRTHGWRVVTRIDHPDATEANGAALTDLQNGANGLHFVFAGSATAHGFGLAGHTPEAIDALLNGIHLDAGVAIELDAGEQATLVATAVAAHCARRKVDPAATDVHFGIDPIGVAAVLGGGAKTWPDEAPAFAANVIALHRGGFRGQLCVADGRVVHAAGGSDGQELAFAVASAASYLRALEAGGMALEQARHLIGFRLAADADQFATIAKHRALRILWARIEAACGLEARPVHIHAETAWRMTTKHDPWVNAVRATLATAAAGLGGADAITVLPLTQAIGLPDAFARRLARNTQLILLEESNLAKVADPAAGSGGIDGLTDALAKTAWGRFQAAERAGGLWATIENGALQSDILAVRGMREANIATRREPLMGASMFAHLDEKPVPVLRPMPVGGAPPQASAKAVAFTPLPAMQLSEPFDRLRCLSDIYLNRSGHRPQVFLANLGKPAEFGARAEFGAGLFEAGGFRAPPQTGFETTAAAAEAFRKSGASLACLCASDKTYAEAALETVTALRDEGATAVFIAGKPGDNETRLRQAGLTRYIFAGCDAVDVLRAAHAAL